ncbi:MAG: hypothetical protein ABSG15_04390 [FCB group bacterium]
MNPESEYLPVMLIDCIILIQDIRANGCFEETPSLSGRMTID